MKYLIKILILTMVAISSVGFFLKNPRKTVIIEEIPGTTKVIWGKITNIEGQTIWRSDIKEVRLNSVIEGFKTFTEYPESGPAITFREVIKEVNQRYRIDIIPTEGFAGYSTIDIKQEKGKVIITFLEVSDVSNPFRRILSYIFYDPGARMKVYINDLKATISLGRANERR